MAFYDHIASVADSLITKYGRSLVFVPAPDVSDSSKPWRGPDLSADPPAGTSAIGVITDYSEDEIDGVTVLRGDKRCLTRMAGIEDPNSFKTIVDGSETWRIVRIDVTKPGDTFLLHEIQIRR